MIDPLDTPEALDAISAAHSDLKARIQAARFGGGGYLAVKEAASVMVATLVAYKDAPGIALWVASELVGMLGLHEQRKAAPADTLAPNAPAQ